jgi:hypothetical protein
VDRESLEQRLIALRVGQSPDGAGELPSDRRQPVR